MASVGRGSRIASNIPSQSQSTVEPTFGGHNNQSSLIRRGNSIANITTSQSQLITAPSFSGPDMNQARMGGMNPRLNCYMMQKTTNTPGSSTIPSNNRMLSVFWAEVDERRRVKMAGEQLHDFDQFMSRLETAFHRKIDLAKFRIEWSVNDEWYMIDTSEELQDALLTIAPSTSAYFQIVSLKNINIEEPQGNSITASCDRSKVYDIDVAIDRRDCSIKNIQASLRNRHFNIVCDGCGSSEFSGNRYKCMQCEDYDLCHICYDSANMHMEHEFVCIEKPISTQCMTSNQNMLNKLPSLAMDIARGLTPPFNEQQDAAARPDSILQPLIDRGWARKMGARQTQPVVEEKGNATEMNDDATMDGNADYVDTSSSLPNDTVMVNHCDIPNEAPMEDANVKDSLDARVEEALKQMAEMGFHDDSGWLKILLKERNSNVFEVLELMDPKTSGSSDEK